MSFIKPIVASLAMAALVLPAHAAEQPAKSIQPAQKHSFSRPLHLSGALNFLHQTQFNSNGNKHEFGLNNANLFVDFGLTKGVQTHFNILMDGETVDLDEATISYNVAKSPVEKVTIGQTYTPFGGSHNLYTANPSLIQSMTQSKETLFSVSAKMDQDVYGQVWAYSHPVAGESSRFSKWGALAGYRFNANGVKAEMKAAWINDLRTVDNSVITLPESSKSVGAWHTTVNAKYANFDAKAEYMSAQSHLSADVKPSVWHVGLGYGMQWLGHGHHVAVGYERASEETATVLPHKVHEYANYTIAWTKNLSGVLNYDHYKAFAGSENINRGSVGVEVKF